MAAALAVGLGRLVKFAGPPGRLVDGLHGTIELLPHCNLEVPPRPVQSLHQVPPGAPGVLVELGGQVGLGLL